MLSSRRARLVLGGVALLVLLGVGWTAWQVWQVNRDLADAVDHAEALRSAVEAGDDAMIDAELAALRSASEEAADGTSGITWSLLTRLPVYGDDARGVRTASRVVEDLADHGVEPLLAVSDQLESLLPRDGAVPVEGVAEIGADVSAAADAFAQAQADLAAEDPSGFDPRLAEQYHTLEEQVARAAAAMRSADRAVAVLPAMLGGAGPREFLLVFQNNAEIRATGGLPGAVSLVRSDGGELTIERQVAAADLGRAPAPVLPIAAPERKLYDDVPASYFVSSNMIPDVPRVADLMRARWEQAYPDDEVSGVVLVDTVALSYVLEATGPVTVDGLSLSGDNVVDELLHATYVRLDDPKDQDAFFAEVAAEAFERFTNGLSDPVALVRALSRATSEGRIHLHSFDATEQAALAGTTIAGEIGHDPHVEEPQVAITLNDATGAKMSYFLRYEVAVTATSCSGGVQGIQAKVRLRSEAPADAAELPDYITGGGEYLVKPGNQLVTLRIFGPVGGSIDELELNAEPEPLIRVDQDGRTVGMTYIELRPGQTVDLAWTMTSGEGQTGDLDVQVTPSIVPGSLGGEVSSAC